MSSDYYVFYPVLWTRIGFSADPICIRIRIQVAILILNEKLPFFQGVLVGSEGDHCVVQQRLPGHVRPSRRQGGRHHGNNTFLQCSGSMTF